MPNASSKLGWEQTIPGTYDREIAALTRRGVHFKVDEEAFSKGTLIIDVDWPYKDRTVRLRAIYPQAFPFFRPDVKVLDAAERPHRHCSPEDGSLCLLGRDTRQWKGEWTLIDLLDSQFTDAMTGGGNEDPQGESMEVFWNYTAARDSYCLIQSDWEPGSTLSGTADVRAGYTIAHGEMRPRVVLSNLKDNAGKTLCEFAGALPPGFKVEGKIGWVKLHDEIAPNAEGIRRLIQAMQSAPNVPPLKFGTHVGRIVGIAFPTEVAHKVIGLGWAFAWIPGRELISKGNGRPVTLLRTLRASHADLLNRSPASSVVSGRAITVMGVGALGAPIALELARLGCKKLSLVDHDVVEPGNSVRWPLGTSAWGRNKAVALKEFIEANYPLTEVSAFENHIGNAGSNDELVVNEAITKSDLVVDASASFGVTVWLDMITHRFSVPMVSAFSTQSVEGGAVVSISPVGSCSVCLEKAWMYKLIEEPKGWAEGDTNLFQPLGCAERTFSGNGHDLKELSLEAVRAAVNRLASPSAVSEVDVLCFGADGLPDWQKSTIPQDPNCLCNQFRAV